MPAGDGNSTNMVQGYEGGNELLPLLTPGLARSVPVGPLLPHFQAGNAGSLDTDSSDSFSVPTAGIQYLLYGSRARRMDGKPAIPGPQSVC